MSNVISSDVGQSVPEPTEADVARALFDCLARNRNLLNPTRLTLFILISRVGTVVGLVTGGIIGSKVFGTLGLFIGGFVGLLTGWLIGDLPSRIAHRSFFKELKTSSTTRLQEIVAMEPWNAWQTMALLQLAARDADVSGEWPRIMTMLESENPVTRTYGWNAVWMVYPDKAKLIPDFDPDASHEICRNKAALLSEGAVDPPLIHGPEE